MAIPDPHPELTRQARGYRIRHDRSSDAASRSPACLERILFVSVFHDHASMTEHVG